MTRLFIGNVPATATEDSMRALFAAHGTVESFSLIVDQETGRLRGFGFAEMPDTDAARAIQALHGAEVDGRVLKVSETHERERPNNNSKSAKRNNARRY